MRFTVVSLSAIDEAPLAPAPSIRDYEYISERLRVDTTSVVTDLMSGPIEVLTDYRGVMLYCTGSVKVHRIAPPTLSVNGMISLPRENSDEEVVISHINGHFKAVVHFE
jgi:hypothetical protein